MNKYLFSGVTLLAVISGYFLYTSTILKAPTEETERFPIVASGTIINIDQSQIILDGPSIITINDADVGTFIVAVPSMGLPLCPAADNIADVAQAAVGDTIEVSGSMDSDGYIVPCDSPEHYLTLTSVARDTVLGFEFSYRKGPNGYLTLEDRESTHVDFFTGLMLVNKKEQEEFEQSDDPREGPPAMHVHVYRNTNNEFASVWSEKNPLESNSSSALGAPEEAVVGGANAVHFVADGLYPIDTYVVAHGEHIYVLMGAHLDTESVLYKDFQSLVSSLVFIPSPGNGAQGKIDARVACESTLAYMTFADDNEADAFVARCVAGEHPEIIERYINDLGLDAATI